MALRPSSQYGCMDADKVDNIQHDRFSQLSPLIEPPGL